ncbi:MAG: mechanosensitive ion channel family protein [Alphaproteobacteria bacterium]|nr:mechanosensitive ion channel family protein [Alphaproteobacteria bacterium]
MIRIFVFLLIIFQAFPCFASTSLVLPEVSQIEASPKSKEIKKIAKLIEDPIERAKLLKTLKVLASAQEAEEKKRSGSLVAYIAPFIQMSLDRVATFFKSLKKIPTIVNEVIDFLKVENNKDDFWKALQRLPILILMGAFFEGILTLIFQRRLEERRTRKQTDVGERHTTYAYMTLFYPFLYSLLFLPLFVPNPSVGNWLLGFWLTIFAIRTLLLERKLTQSQDTVLRSMEPGSKGRTFLRVLGGVALWAILMSGINIVFDTKNYGEEFVTNLIIFISFPLLVLYFREWRAQEMQRQLSEGKSLITAPHFIAPFVNIFIRYLPWVLFVISIPLAIDKIFFAGNLWEAYGSECIETFIVLFAFLVGRRYLDSLHKFQLPKFKAAKIQTFISYITPIQLPLLKGVQWLWHLTFFVILIFIWDRCFSSLFMTTFSHPFVKTISTIVLILSILYLLWFALDLFVQFHIKPQMIKGKRREPTAFAKTFGPMLHSVARWLMILIAFFVTLESFGFDLKLLVYLMSAFAFAISLGSQSLVKDIINGFFALVDGSFSVGDVVTVGAHTGAVESLSLRAITLRHRDGSLQKIPFSEVGNIINRSRDYTVVPIDIATSHKTKISTVYEAISLAIEEMSKDPTFGKMILEPLSISGVDRFAENAVHVSASIKITPDPNNTFVRDLNRRLKIHMDALGIAPPISFQEEWVKDKDPLISEPSE